MMVCVASEWWWLQLLNTVPHFNAASIGATTCTPLLPSNDSQPLVGAETAADMGEEEVDMVELREEEMVDKVNE